MSIDIEVRHAFGDFALHANFQVGTGLTALFGPSGSGKTTTINAIAGLLRPEYGRIVLNGRTVFDSNAGIFVPSRDRRVAYVFQEARLFPHMTVETNLRFGWRRAPSRLTEPEIHRIVELLGLESLLARRPRNLSGGERSRVALGRALLSSPEILLLDEPLAALDAARKAEILPYLEHLRDSVRLPILYVSHSLEEVSRLADQVVVMQRGRSVASGTVFDVLTDLALPDVTGAAPYGTVFDAEIRDHHAADGITILDFAGGILVVPLLSRPIGMRLRVRVAAEDVMLAIEEPVQISANNILAGSITDIRTTERHADVRLLCGQTPFVARITRASRERLSLAAGMRVFAIVKSVTVAPQIDPLGR
ncbi:MAG TPA: molybdenum ABC transporter ATP-binding protein [Rhizomicrobium sp.]|nr:molybdenum ABC transporter ATP-binding protein [Rhizomicrobium sp.]